MEINRSMIFGEGAGAVYMDMTLMSSGEKLQSTGNLSEGTGTHKPLMAFVWKGEGSRDLTSLLGIVDGVSMIRSEKQKFVMAFGDLKIKGKVSITIAASEDEQPAKVIITATAPAPTENRAAVRSHIGALIEDQSKNFLRLMPSSGDDDNQQELQFGNTDDSRVIIHAPGQDAVFAGPKSVKGAISKLEKIIKGSEPKVVKRGPDGDTVAVEPPADEENEDPEGTDNAEE